MALNYATFVSQLANLMVISSADSNFTTFLPGCIDYAENRCYRELDPLYNYITDTSASVSSGVRTFTIPSTFIVVDAISILTSAGALSSNGVRNPLTRVSRQFLDNAYPAALSSKTGQPEFYAMMSSSQAVLGPTPDAAYLTEVAGMQRPTTLSSSNSSSILTQYVPDLFVAASMVFASGFMRDFGAQSDNPQMAQSWENQYQKLLASAMSTEDRAKFQASAWSSLSSPTTATPGR